MAVSCRTHVRQLSEVVGVPGWYTVALGGIASLHESCEMQLNVFLRTGSITLDWWF